MNFKLKTLVAVLALSAVAATSANAASDQSATATGSSMIFSAWDANGSYSLDLGSFLNTFIGADTISGSMLSGTNKTQNLANTLTASNTVFSGTVADIALTGFNLAGAGVQWNLVGGENNGRNRLLMTEATSIAGITNSSVAVATGAIGTYIGMGAAASTLTGTLATATDAWYANKPTWGDTLGKTGWGGTSNSLTGTSNLVAVWQQSVSVATALAGGAAGFANLTNLAGSNFTVSILGSGANSFLHIAAAPVAAVPEADTSAMMLAGLGLMGFIARRRNRKQA